MNILIILITFVNLCNNANGAGSGSPAKHRINTKTILSETDEQIHKDLKAYRKAHAKIFEAESNWEGAYADKIRQNNAEIAEAISAINQAMATEKAISADQLDQIVHKMHNTMQTARQTVDHAFAGIETAQRQKHKTDVDLAEAEAEMELARQRLSVAKHASTGADAALHAAEAERVHAIDEMDKKRKVHQTVNEHLMNIEVARTLNSHYQEEVAMKSGQREALDPLIQQANVHYNNLYKSKRKLLLDREIEELVQVKGLHKYKQDLDALTFRPLMDIRDKIVYLGTKYFGLDEDDIEAERRKCMEDAQLNIPYLINLINRLKAGLKRWNSSTSTISNTTSRHDEQQQQQQELLLASHSSKQSTGGGVCFCGARARDNSVARYNSVRRQKTSQIFGAVLNLTGTNWTVILVVHHKKPNEMLSYVARALCLYTAIGNHMPEEEKQRLNELMEKEEQKSGQKNIDLVGHQLDAQVEKQVRALISEHQITEYPTDQSAVAQQLLLLDQGESSGVTQADEAFSLEEISQALIKEQQRSDVDQSVNELASIKQVQRRRTLKEMFSKQSLGSVKEVDENIERSEPEDEDQMINLDLSNEPKHMITTTSTKDLHGRDVDQHHQTSNLSLITKQEPKEKAVTDPDQHQQVSGNVSVVHGQKDGRDTADQPAASQISAEPLHYHPSSELLHQPTRSRRKSQDKVEEATSDNQ